MTGTTEDLAQRIEEIVLRRLADDRLLLPAPPAAAGRLLAAVQQADGGLRQAAAAVSVDPILAAQVVRLAQSAAMGGPGGVRTVEQAVTRLGAQRLRTFAAEAAARKLFESRDPRIVQTSRRLWEHSVAVALLARDLAALCGSLDGDNAYLAGLLHDVGKPVLAAVLLEAERMLAGSRPRAAWFTSDVWLEAITRVHRQVGAALVERWGLPEAVVTAVRDAGDFDAADRSSVPNFVRFANAVAKERGLCVGPVDTEDNSALVMVGRSLLGVDDELLGRLVAELHARVRQQLDG